jgi:Protein of unknown function (DUF4231)
MPNIKPEFDEKQRQALDQCNHLIKDFANRADRHKNRYKRLQFVSIGLAVSTTVLSALSASNKLDSIAWIVPIVSGLATLSTTFLTQTNSQKMWVQSRNITQKLQVEEFLYTQNSGEYGNLKDEEERLQLFSKRIMEVWTQAQETWSQSASSAK